MGSQHPSRCHKLAELYSAHLSRVTVLCLSGRKHILTQPVRSRLNCLNLDPFTAPISARDCSSKMSLIVISKLRQHSLIELPPQNVSVAPSLMKGIARFKKAGRMFTPATIYPGREENPIDHQSAANLFKYSQSSLKRTRHSSDLPILNPQPNLHHCTFRSASHPRPGRLRPTLDTIIHQPTRSVSHLQVIRHS
ncbi:hypothetical protein CRM22_008726 [Opisthorchis felineus]|uniref:Uncharacterized protein n=1 Tax=Opisthorchis felineus TaxID=147828 RepID=A0A4V6RGU0_OPIFE|nr:hypothetical protein CRM22_008726 [Opisthorchis felineus]